MIALSFQKAIQDPRSYVSNPYGNYYAIRPGIWNYHPGIDVIFQEGSIAHFPIKAVAWTQITWAGRVTAPGFEVWGNLIVGRCDLDDGTSVYCRYAHVENILVNIGQWVHPGQHIADVGDAYGAYVYHLDFCISPTKVLLTTPWDWPGIDLQRVYKDYVDPISFVERHKLMVPDYTNLSMAMGNMQAAWEDLQDEVAALKAQGNPNPEPPPSELAATVNSSNGLNVRTSPTVNSAVKVGLLNGTKLTVEDSGVDADSHRWMKITAGPDKAIGGYVAKDLLSFP